MERFNVDADQAFAVLRRYSQDHNIKLRRVAEYVVANRQLPHKGVDDSTLGTNEPS
jgi:AmiR/NasT family two-component response regulator